MSPRRNRRYSAASPVNLERASTFGETVEDGPDGRWRVRGVAADRSAKTYRCPGCDQEIPPGVAHVVAWPDDGAVDERRHWHRPCWRARGTRRPNRRR
ncbi:hypothetical protein [Stackebrandtia soli]|uniref:hypothetical protein n=1 Tax=Stackebrandtia soli TaxID=1892856 RepID=UPI0039ED58E9